MNHNTIEILNGYDDDWVDSGWRSFNELQACFKRRGTRISDVRSDKVYNYLTILTGGETYLYRQEKKEI